MTANRQPTASPGGTHQRSRHAGNFVIVPNTAAQMGKPLSLRAVGLLTYILSLPADRPITTAGIVEHWPEGRDAIRSAIRELREAGFAREFRSQDSAGHWARRTVYYDTQQIDTDCDIAEVAPKTAFQVSA